MNDSTGMEMEGIKILDRDAMLKELLDYCNNWIDKSSEWRRSSFEEDWNRWQRNSDSIYDPEIARKKKGWQSKAVWPITASHRENAQAQLFKTEVGPRPPWEVKPRKGVTSGQPDQSENIRDLLLREREKSRYELERNKVIEDKTTYGSGFARMRFETRTEERKVRDPIYEEINLNDPMSIQRSLSGQKQIIGYEDKIKEVITYRGVVFEHISIWDVFPDPKALKILGNSISYRYYTTYGEIIEGAQIGYYLPESIKNLKDIASEEEIEIDRKTVQNDRKIKESRINRPKYGARLKCYELYARLPKKWILINGEEIDDPEKLIPAIIRFHKNTVISVEVNDSYDGEPPIYKDDYMPVAGRFYGRGVPEMLKDVQLVSSETINQRLDSGSIGLMQKFAVIEKALVDPKDLEEDRNVIRLKQPSGLNVTDVGQVFSRVDMGGPSRDSFVEPQEWERIAQERTSINRQTLGTAGQVKDANQTLGGQQLLLQATGDKMAFLGMLSEYDFQYEVVRAYWRLIYSNYSIDDVAIAIGPERAQSFIFMTPEEIENNYQYYVMGIFTMENKAQRQARLAAIDAQFGAMPYFNRLEILKAELNTSDEDPEKFIIQEAEAMQIQMKAQEMAQQQIGAIIGQSGPPSNQTPGQ